MSDKTMVTSKSIRSMFFRLLVALVVGVTLGCSDKGATSDAKGQEKGAKSKKGEKSAEGEKGHAEKGGGGELKLTDAEINQGGIKVEQIAEETVRDTITLTATIQANQERMAHVAARVPGRIVKVNAALGQRVSAGQTLAVLDSIDIGEARSSFRQARSEVTLAQADFERYERLYKEQIVPQKDWLRARSQLEKSQAGLRAATDKLQMLGTSPDGQGSTFPVTAPFAGTVIEKKAVLGELAEPKDSLFTVADVGVVWIEANLFERDLGRVKIGSPAVVTVGAYPNEQFRGTLRYISNAVDKETRTARARVEVANPGEKLKLEMFATVALQTDVASKAVVVPEEAVVLFNNQPSVYVENANAFVARPVELGPKLSGRVVLKSGVTPGEVVVVSGAYALKARQLKSQIGDAH